MLLDNSNFNEILNSKDEGQSDEKVERKNAKQMPKRYFARHMVQGVAGYNDGKIFVSNDAINSMNKSFEGKPVYANVHRPVDMEKLEEEACGYVVKSFYNELDGWHWAEILITSDEGHEAVGKGYAVSNAYIPTSFGNGGTFLNVPYEKAVLGGDFTHLAIVAEPRYEEACVMDVEEYKAYCAQKRSELDELQNSKDEKKEGIKKMFKFFRMEKTEVSSEEISNASDLSGISMEVDGNEVALDEMVNAVAEMKKKEEEDKEEKENEVDMDKKIKVNGSEMTLSEVVSEYKSMCEKKNAEDEEKKNSEEEAKKEEEEKAKKEEAQNSKGFAEMKNAIEQSKSVAKPTIELRSDMIKRGKEQY